MEAEMLSKKELEVIRVAGLPVKEASAMLKLPESTVRGRFQKMFARFGVENRAALVLYCLKNDILKLSDFKLSKIEVRDATTKRRIH